MIRFKCIYCGQRMLAKEGGAGKKGKCPKCAHVLVVPKTTKGRPAISVEKTEPVTAAQSRHSSATDDFLELKTRQIDPDEAKELMTDVYKESFGFLIPTYDELSLFLIAITLIMLCVFNINMRDQLWKFVMQTDDLRTYILVALLFAALCLCLYHPFTTREKSNPEKWLMLVLAVLANGGIGIAAGAYMLERTVGWLAIFPLWNIINGLFLLVMLRLKVIDEKCITDRDATPFQVGFGLIAVVIIFIICNFIYQLYWAITFSICIVYTTSFDRALQSVFGPPPDVSG